MINNEIKVREKRKDEHIKYFLSSYPAGKNGFEDIVFKNNSLPELSFDEIDTQTSFAGRKIAFPLIINAITGGTHYTMEINIQLAAIASKFGIPMAVGSQAIAIDNKECRYTFEVVRQINPDGIIMANISALRSLDDALEAVEIIKADAVQLHLNAPQEIAMAEGDRDFRGVLDNIKHIVSNIKLPVIVKEVGFGMSYETVKKLYEAGVKYIDIGGKGGTNFVHIENMRRNDKDMAFLEGWGMPTAFSLLEAKKVSDEINIICSGGISKAEEVVKALVMGADMAGISGAILRKLLEEGMESAISYIEDIIYQSKVFMFLLGAKDIETLKKAPYLIKGELKQLIL